MKCDNCEKEATVHELLPGKGGKIVERHLCEQCAREAGVAIQAHLPLTQLLSQFLTAQTKAAPATGGAAGTAQAGVCRTCGISYTTFRHSGLLGCPDCYRSFEPQLAPLLERAHEGGTHHVGKVPRYLQSPSGAPPQTVPIAQPVATSSVPPPPPATAKAPKAAKPVTDAAKIQTLRKQLTEAVAAEQYEKAAQLRDELNRLEGKEPGRPGAPAQGRKPESPKPEKKGDKP